MPAQMALLRCRLPAWAARRQLSSAAAAAAASSGVVVARSFLYVPASSEKMVAGLARRRPLPDMVVLDCEDGVAYAAKAAARLGARRALCDLRLAEACGRVVAVRINPPAAEGGGGVSGVFSSLAEEDLNCVVDSPRPPDVLVLPKVESAADVAWLADRLGRFHQLRQPMSVILMIESAAALLAMPSILDAAAAASRLRPIGCVFGSDDFCSSMGVERSTGGEETRHARAQFALAARSRGLLAIDMVEIDLADAERFRRQCREGRALGFTGKQIIHPSQLAPCHEEFSPPPARVAWAERMCAEFERHSAAGAGAFVFEGQMIDMPTVRQGQALMRMRQTLLAYEGGAAA